MSAATSLPWEPCEALVASVCHVLSQRRLHEAMATSELAEEVLGRARDAARQARDDLARKDLGRVLGRVRAAEQRARAERTARDLERAHGTAQRAYAELVAATELAEEAARNFARVRNSLE
ncbi:MAG: hypothetical protein JWM74_4157 [Myxococcaceae bacterium]|nr:hypothetical protein [Myxococcaceae bacterium]